MQQVLYAMLLLDENQVRLGYVNDKARLIERLDRACAYMHLDASVVATVPEVELRRLLGELKEVPQTAVQPLCDEGEVVCAASVLPALKAGLQKHGIKHQRVATVLARTAPTEEWQARIEQVRTAHRLRVLRRKARACDPLNEQLLEECERFLDGLLQAAGALYVHPADDSVDVYAISSDPESAQRLTQYLADEDHQTTHRHRNGSLVFASGGCTVFTSTTCLRGENRVLFCVTVAFSARRLFGRLAPHIQFGFEELLARLRALPRVAPGLRIELEQVSSQLWDELYKTA